MRVYLQMLLRVVVVSCLIADLFLISVWGVDLVESRYAWRKEQQFLQDLAERRELLLSQKKPRDTGAKGVLERLSGIEAVYGQGRPRTPLAE